MVVEERDNASDSATVKVATDSLFQSPEGFLERPLSCVPSAISQSFFPRSVTGMDMFFAGNAVLFLLMCMFAYYDRWVKYRGQGHVAMAEFVFYAVVLIVGIGVLWGWLRRYAVPSWLLVLIEVGILAHFAGGLVHFGGARLYDHIYGGIRYDKYVHFANAFIAALTVQKICQIKNLPVTGFMRLGVFLTVLGLGSVVEICEFAVTLTIPHNGVGGYDDNMRDLLSNACGGGLFLALGGLRKRVVPLS